MPTTAHFIYIPAILIIGIVIGFILGGRAARDAFAAQKEKEAARAARRAARAQSGGAPSGDAPADGPPSSER
ncbi:MAG: hypothetical protein JWN44_7155 [Myxococcales bacterium]|nr:hypothetical protein [Myxococcales bacterium]